MRRRIGIIRRFVSVSQGRQHGRKEESVKEIHWDPKPDSKVWAQENGKEKGGAETSRPSKSSSQEKVRAEKRQGNEKGSQENQQEKGGEKESKQESCKEKGGKEKDRR